MGLPIAKKGDKVIAVDMHVVLVNGIPTPLPHPFTGYLDSKLSANVSIMGGAGAKVGSKGGNRPKHVPTPPGTSFVVPPTNMATVLTGSASVFINGKQAARNASIAQTCNDPAPLPVGVVLAVGSVLVGG